MKKVYIVLSMIILSMQSITRALTPKEEKGVIVLKDPSLVYEAPDRVQAFPLEEAPDDIDFWKQVLPYEQDRDEDMYIVMPTIGVVAPIVMVPEGTTDFDEMVSGRQIEINNYLDRGVMHYPNTGIPGENANPVIFGHSNFYKNGIGDYKTIFADIMNLDVSPYDEMWVYVRQDDGTYDLRKFAITASYETVPTDVGVMLPQGGKEITVFACTNGLAGRWILKGKMIPPEEVLVTYPMKWELIDIMEVVANQAPQVQQETIATVLVEIERIRQAMPTGELDYHDKYKKYLLNYIEQELLEVY